ncbi:MAG TPA: hypothetical protein VFQ25_15160 [Ktedonobacterales bacterium]|nr:hypothetical protein [Ktedonobacterales bacterium]
MELDRRITFYRSAIPWMILLGGCLAILLGAGLILLFHRPLSAKDANGGWFVIAIFGMGAVTIAGYLINDRRKPLLRITPEGVASPYSRFPSPTLGWADIRSLTFLRQAPSRNPTRPRHLLVVTIRSPKGLRDPNTLEARWPPVESLPDKEHTAIVLMLEVAYLFASTDEIRARTLERIKTVFAPEIARYGIAVVEPGGPR